MRDEYFAINVGKILSILEMQKITEVPDSPLYMKGVINLRGEVLPVIDSHIKFGFENQVEITPKTCILVIEVESSTTDSFLRIGLLVDEVEEVAELQEVDIQEPPTVGNGQSSKYITGMYKKGSEGFIMLLDINNLLSTTEEVLLIPDQGIDSET